MTAVLRCLCPEHAEGWVFYGIKQVDAYMAHIAQQEAPMARTVKIHVLGIPIPQGSLQLHPHPKAPGKVTARYPATVYRWRSQVQQAVLEAGEPVFEGAVEVKLGFDLPRPAGHYLPINSKRTTPVLNPRAPMWPTVAPDLDKLIRAICDSCTDAGLWKDDSQVCLIQTAKRYAIAQPGVLITVSELS